MYCGGAGHLGRFDSLHLLLKCWRGWDCGPEVHIWSYLWDSLGELDWPRCLWMGHMEGERVK